MRDIHWAEHALPDLIWVAMTIEAFGDSTAYRFSSVQSAWSDYLKSIDVDPQTQRFEGRLSDIERIAEAYRPKFTELIESSRLSLQHLTTLNHLYPDLPGGWLAAAVGEEESEPLPQAALEGGERSRDSTARLRQSDDVRGGNGLGRCVG